ncbi:MAG: TetR/AcrR family transcriptional regulator [Anaerolineae bacterium]
MTFGKLGRPPEDSLARQREIYVAISPLILETGVRRLSMRLAARTACLSVGGLYHHFATKQDLVLHGMQPEAIGRYCQDFHDKCGYLITADPKSFLDVYLEFLSNAIEFIRPAFFAALELGIETFEKILEPSLTAVNQEFAAAFRAVFPNASEDDIFQAGRAIHRSIVSALFDKNITRQEFHREVCALISGYFEMPQKTFKPAPPSLVLS